MFNIKFLPATIGDAIWVSYGNLKSPHHLLIDGGTKGTRAFIQRELESLPPSQRKFELVVVSHVDKDHIGGILTLLQRQEVQLEIEDFWFNAFKHLPVDDDRMLSIDEGEQLTSELVDQKIPWNTAFGTSGKNAVMIPDGGDLPKIQLAGGMELTLLSPSKFALANLAGQWRKEIEDAGLAAGMELPDDDNDLGNELLSTREQPDIDLLAATPFKDDNSLANGSSIAFIADYKGKRVLFAADAQVGKLLQSLNRYSPRERVKLDLLKVSHHGSKSTTSRELIAKLDCPRYVFSSNGSIFKHPHAETVSRVISAGGDLPQLFFNYKSNRNSIWEDKGLQKHYRYTTIYPSNAESGIEISL